MPERFEFLANLGVVVDFAIEDDDGVAVFGAHGLIAAGEIDDLEPHRAHRDIRGFMRALLIRAAMIDALHRAAQYASGRFSPEMGETRYAAHMKRTRIED